MKRDDIYDFAIDIEIRIWRDIAEIIVYPGEDYR